MINVLRPSLFRSSIAFSSALGLGIMLRPRRIIRNDTPAVRSPLPQSAPTKEANRGLQIKREDQTYRDLCIGSVSGLLLGSIVGKFSTLLVALSLSTYLLLQFFENRNYISIPWNKVFSIGNHRIDLKNLFFKRLSFKLSFSAAFLIAAFNIWRLNSNELIY